MLFLGEYSGSFSGPSRLLLPKKIRELLTGASFVLTRGIDGCLAGYDSAAYERKAQSLFEDSMLDRSKMPEKRLLFASTVYAEFDDQGRFVIPKHLLEFAHLQKAITIVGAGDHFEIWNDRAWNTYKEQQSL